MMVLTDKGAVHYVCKDRFVLHHGTPRRVTARRGASRRLAARQGVSRRVKASAGVVNKGRSRVLAGVTPRRPPCEPYPTFGEFRRPFSPYEDPCRRPPKTDEVHLPIACKRTAPAAPAARARASTVWHLQPAQHIAMTACALLGRITLVGPVHHGLFGAIAV